jgi:hypothetical protein
MKYTPYRQFAQHTINAKKSAPMLTVFVNEHVSLRQERASCCITVFATNKL